MLLEYKTTTEAQLEEASIREEMLIKSNEEFKQEMKQQAEETQKMMKQLMEMMKQKQAQPEIAHLSLFFSSLFHLLMNYCYFTCSNTLLMNLFLL